MNIVLNASFLDFTSGDAEHLRKKWMVKLRSMSGVKLSYNTVQLLSHLLINKTNSFKDAKYVFIDLDSIPFLENEKDVVYEFSALFSTHDNNSNSPPVMIDKYENMNCINERDELNKKIETLKNELLSLLKKEDQDRGNVLISELSELLSLSGIPYA